MCSPVLLGGSVEQFSEVEVEVEVLRSIRNVCKNPSGFFVAIVHCPAHDGEGAHSLCFFMKIKVWDIFFISSLSSSSFFFGSKVEAGVALLSAGG